MSEPQQPARPRPGLRWASGLVRLVGWACLLACLLSINECNSRRKAIANLEQLENERSMEHVRDRAFSSGAEDETQQALSSETSKIMSVARTNEMLDGVGAGLMFGLGAALLGLADYLKKRSGV